MWGNPVRIGPGRVWREDYECERREAVQESFGIERPKDSPPPTPPAKGRETIGSFDALEFFKVS